MRGNSKRILVRKKTYGYDMGITPLEHCWKLSSSNPRETGSNNYKNATSLLPCSRGYDTMEGWECNYLKGGPMSLSLPIFSPAHHASAMDSRLLS